MVAKKATSKKSVGTPSSKSGKKGVSASKSGKTSSRSRLNETLPELSGSLSMDRSPGRVGKLNETLPELSGSLSTDRSPGRVSGRNSGSVSKSRGTSGSNGKKKNSQIGTRNTDSTVFPKGKHFPAPWNLKGEGFLFPLWAKKDYNREMGFFSGEDSKQYTGGLGSLMLVNYETSDVGPYYELLYIPGNFTYKDESYKRITRIFVSSQKSVEEGILNWAIPKEKADFTWIREENLTKISAFRNGKEFFRVTIATKGFSFPVSTKILPYTLLQKATEGYLSTQFVGKGKGRIATIREIWSDEAVFPDAVKGGIFKTGIHSDPFELIFPVADVID